MSSSSPRVAAIERLARLVPAWPDLPIDDRGDGGLGDAIVQEAIRRWRTIEFLAGLAAGRDPVSLEPALRAVLLAGGAQIAFMGEPAHAVVDESVEHAKRMIRPGAGRLVNAVLRRMADTCRTRGARPDDWWLRRDLVPLADGGVIELDAPMLPDPIDVRLAISTSHAERLIARWLERFGVEQTAQWALRGVMQPPRIVADPRGALSGHERTLPHERPGFVVWTGSLAELRSRLAHDPSLRVQDPGSAWAVERTRGLAPARVVDACAGRGTKTRQLAELHPHAEIFAADRDPARHAALARAFAGHPRVRVVAFDVLASIRNVELLLLDVPCTNTGVLPRRPEAKGRFDERRLASLLATQREIVEKHLPSLAPSGHLLHVTCSLESEENEAMSGWISRRIGRDGRFEFHAPRGGPGEAGSRYADGGASTLV